MKNFIVLFSLILLLTSCWIGIWDWKVKIDWGENGKIDIWHWKVNIEWNWIWKVDIWRWKVNIQTDNNLDLWWEWLNELEDNIIDWNNEDKSKFELMDDYLRIDFNDWTTALKIKPDYLRIDFLDNTTVIKLQTNYLRIDFLNNATALKIQPNYLRIDDNLRKTLVKIQENYYNNEWKISKTIKFNNWLQIWDSFEINDTLKIWDWFEFTDSWLKIWNYEIKEDGLYKNWKKIRSLTSLKNKNFEITKNFIKFWNDIMISKDWIIFYNKKITKNRIQFSEKTYIQNWKIVFNWEEK